MWPIVLLLPLALVAVRAQADANGTRPDRPLTAAESLQRALYGTPRDATIEDMLARPADFEGRAVRVRGRFTRARERGQFQLGVASQGVRLEPIPAIGARVRAQAPTWLNQDIDLVGVFLRDRRDEDDGQEKAVPRFLLRFWQYDAPTSVARAPSDTPPTTLEQLVYGGGKSDGQTVRVVGQFRGNNLRGDLPPASRRSESDWVLKDEFYAVWITGHGPSGDGFELDPAALADQENWLEVVGRPVTRNGITYFSAQHVYLAEPPASGATARSAPARNALAVIPPTVVFTLPVNGEEGAPADVRLVIQFNKSMDEGSFAGRVRLRPADAEDAAEEVRLAYDESKHALVVEPARPLPPGRELVLELLEGIIDVHGQPLRASRGPATAGAVEAVRFRVAG